MNKTKTIKAKEVVDYNLDNGGLHQITFVCETNGYFAICRDFDEEDEKIYFEIDDQCNAHSVFPEKVEYHLTNGRIEFIFNEPVPNVSFENQIIIEFPIVSQEQLDAITKTLQNIWEK